MFLTSHHFIYLSLSILVNLIYAKTHIKTPIRIHIKAYDSIAKFEKTLPANSTAIPIKENRRNLMFSKQSPPTINA